jgi:hypothetical protein
MNVRKRGEYFHLLNLVLCIVSLTVLTSCDTYHFSSPQPIDAVNLNQFPKEARGIWVDEQDHDTVVIGKKVVAFHSYEKQIILKPFGKWEGIMDRPTGYYSFKSVKYDTTLKMLDTVSNYIIKDNLIYEIKNGLQRGCPFTVKKDTIYCVCKNKFILELGEKFFLREITKGQYIVNVHESLVIRPESEWWQILLMEIGTDKVKTYFPNSKIRTEGELIYRSNDEYFFSTQWSRAGIQQKIKEGLFSNKYKILSRVKK